MRISTTVVICSWILLTGLVQGVAVAADEQTPEALVKQITADVLDAIKQDPALRSGDRRKALALAEEKVLPLIDFRESTRLAVGRAWAQASKEQQERLVEEFRRMLVRTYSNSISRYEGQTIEVLPARYRPEDTEVTVRNQYRRRGRPPVQLDYTMRRSAEGWKIYDIVVEGVSLVITYRSEFDVVVKQSGIDGLIKRLAEKNTPAKVG